MATASVGSVGGVRDVRPTPLTPPQERLQRPYRGTFTEIMKSPGHSLEDHKIFRLLTISTEQAFLSGNPYTLAQG